MKAVGIRVSPQEVRYAVVEYDGASFSLLNDSGENRLVFPANQKNIEDKIHWLYGEFERIAREVGDADKFCIKNNEYTRSDTKPKRETVYLEGGILLLCATKGISVEGKLYASLNTNSAAIKQNAEARVGRTQQRWDKKMADAVIVAWNGVKP